MHCLLKMNKLFINIIQAVIFFFWSEINKIIKFSEKNLKVVIWYNNISSKYLCIKLKISINRNNNKK